MNKKDRLMEILETLREEFPELVHIAVDDLEDPSFLFVGDEDNFTAFAEFMIMSGAEPGDGSTGDMDALFDAINGTRPDAIDWDDDDEGNGGMLQ